MNRERVLAVFDELCVGGIAFELRPRVEFEGCGHATVFIGDILVWDSNADSADDLDAYKLVDRLRDEISSHVSFCVYHADPKNR